MSTSSSPSTPTNPRTSRAMSGTLSGTIPVDRADATVGQQGNLAFPRDPVDERRVPEVEIAPEVLQTHERWCVRLSRCRIAGRRVSRRRRRPIDSRPSAGCRCQSWARTLSSSSAGHSHECRPLRSRSHPPLHGAGGQSPPGPRQNVRTQLARPDGGGLAGQDAGELVRELMSSLMKTLRRWYWTVRGLTNSRVPISGLESPSRGRRAICALLGGELDRAFPRPRSRTVSPVRDNSRYVRARQTPPRPSPRTSRCAVRSCSARVDPPASDGAATRRRRDVPHGELDYGRGSGPGGRSTPGRGTPLHRHRSRAHGRGLRFRAPNRCG